MTLSVYRDTTTTTQRPAGHDWLRWLDVRLPVTVDEGDAALDLIATKIAGLEVLAREVPDRALSAEYALRKWSERLAEVEWTVERLRAGDAPASMDLARERSAHSDTTKKLAESRASLAAADQKIESMRQESTGLRRKGARSWVSDAERGLREANAGLLTAVRQRDATIERLRAAAPPAPVFTADAADVKRAYIARQHENAATALEAIDEIIANGGSHTPVSAMIVTHMADTLAAGYRERWRLLQRPRIEAAAGLNADDVPSGVR